MQGKVSSKKPKSSDAIAGDLKNLVGSKIKCPNGLTMYFIPESFATLPISPNLDLSFHNPLVRQMFLLHNALGEAYPPNCTVGYDTSVFKVFITQEELIWQGTCVCWQGNGFRGGVRF